MSAPAGLEAPDPAFLLLATAVGLGTLHLYRAPLATLAMLLTGAACVGAGKVAPLPLLVAFAAGFASDLALNAYFSGARARAPRGRMLRQYFDRMGALLAAAFAGGITLVMTLGTLALASYAGWTSVAGFLLAGLVVGAGIGVPGTQGSLAMRELLPFYESTSGLLENRAWDGVSQVWAMALVLFSALALCPDKRVCAPGAA